MPAVTEDVPQTLAGLTAAVSHLPAHLRGHAAWEWMRDTAAAAGYDVAEEWDYPLEDLAERVERERAALAGDAVRTGYNS